MADFDLQKASILIIDDEEANVELLESFLAEAGYESLTSTRDSRQVLALYEATRPDLILLDLHMPHLDGFDVMRQLAARVPAQEFVPILVLTADITPGAKERALREGAKDFLSKPLDEVEVLLRIRNLLETRFLYLEQRRARERAESGERRAAFLADASRVLGSSFDSQTTLSMLANLAVPGFADLCLIDLADGEGRFTRAGLAHTDPDRQALLLGDDLTSAAALPLDHPLARLLGEGKPVLLPEIPASLAAVTQGDDVGAGDRRDAWSVVRPHSLVSAPLLSSSGRVLGMLTLVSAESKRRYHADDLKLVEELARRATMALENARLFHEAQQASRARDEVLAVVAHDLRNPLNTIHMAATLLQETLPDGPHRSQLDIVSRSAKRMNGLIQDLLEVTRLESGKLAMDLCPDNVGPLLREAGSMLRPLAAASSLELEVDVEEEIPPVLMDGARILQVISNLVGNAIKFTPAGGRIALRSETIRDAVRFAIADTGPGIPAEQVPHIFGRFWQASDSDRRGIGLGLSIARGIVEAHGGAIWVESAPGAGTTFYFTLPLAEAPGEPYRAESGASRRDRTSESAALREHEPAATS